MIYRVKFNGQQFSKLLISKKKRNSSFNNFPLSQVRGWPKWVGGIAIHSAGQYRQNGTWGKFKFPLRGSREHRNEIWFTNWGNRKCHFTDSISHFLENASCRFSFNLVLLILHMCNSGGLENL